MLEVLHHDRCRTKVFIDEEVVDLDDLRYRVEGTVDVEGLNNGIDEFRVVSVDELLDSILGGNEAIGCGFAGAAPFGTDSNDSMGPLADAEAKLVKVMKFLFSLGSGHAGLGVLGRERGVCEEPNLTNWFSGT